MSLQNGSVGSGDNKNPNILSKSWRHLKYVLVTVFNFSRR